LEEIVGEEADAKLILKAAKSSMGMDTSPQDMSNIHIFTERMISLAQYRKEVAREFPPILSLSHCLH
jgi:nucleolar protein 56